MTFTLLCYALLLCILLIVRLEDTLPNRNAIQVVIARNDHYVCYGTLIKPNWVVTVANVFDNDRTAHNYYVQAGEEDEIFNPNHTYAQRRLVEQIEFHPYYAKKQSSDRYNMAMLRVLTSFSITNIVRCGVLAERFVDTGDHLETMCRTHNQDGHAVDIRYRDTIVTNNLACGVTLLLPDLREFGAPGIYTCITPVHTNPFYETYFDKFGFGHDHKISFTYLIGAPSIRRNRVQAITSSISSSGLVYTDPAGLLDLVHYTKWMRYVWSNSTGNTFHPSLISAMITFVPNYLYQF